MTDTQEPPPAEVGTKRSLRPNTTWKSGEKLPFSYNPSVEGMVVATRWVDEAFMVVFLVPPFKKEGGTWAEASLAYKTANTMIKDPLVRYDFPFPKDYRIVREVNQANGNIEVLQEIVSYINKKYPPPASAVLPVSVEPLGSPWGTEEGETPAPPPTNDDRLSLHMLLSQNEDSPLENQNQLPSAIMEKIMYEVSQRFRLSDGELPKHSDSEAETVKSKRKKKKRSRKKKNESATSSSTSSSSSSSIPSSSSDSSSEASSSDSEVRMTKEERKKGWVKCPFSSSDSRMMISPKEKMKSTNSERVILRKALKNLYNHFTTLKWFVETQKTDQPSSVTRPYASDIVWLKIHAEYLDQLLLQPIAGPWTSWNEIIVDDLARSFLELVVRTSPERKYPDILDEKVRRWMKRKRVGLTTSFGSIPTFLADAKITEDGIQPKGGWEVLKKRDNKISTFPPRSKSSASSTPAVEKKQ